MKKRIIRIWGVCFTITLLASLFMVAAPASAADPLQWYTEVVPSETGMVLQPDLDILDISVNPDGETVYAVGANTTDPKKIYKSNNGGVTWTDISAATGLNITNTRLVACAPDNPDLVLVVDNITGSIAGYVSDDGGIEFSNVALLATIKSITSIDVSAAVGGVHYAAVAGVNTTNHGDVWYYKLGIGGSWTSSNQLDGFNTTSETGYGTTNTCLAIAFSPNFASDQVLTAVTDNGTNVFFEMLSVSTTAAASVWNDAAGFDNYPVTIEDKNGNAILAATGASIALAPTYLGGDEVERVAIVGINSLDDDDMGVYRLMDYVPKQIWDEQPIYSVAYDGTTAVAGETNTIIWRSSDPLTTIPTFYPSATTKSPGGTANPILAWLGTSVVAATAGNESGFSISVDDGKSFNDISLIDTQLSAIEDIAVAADVGKVYMVTDDTADVSVWRRASEWQRVLSITGDTNYIVRTAPDNPDVIYIAEKAGMSVYFGKEGGDSKWYSRRSAHSIQDMAVESEDVAYIAKTNSDAVIKTTNSGFTWGAAEDTKLAGGNIHSIKSLGEDLLIVGGTTGYVSYSTDGNDSWTKIEQQIAAGAGETVVTATGLSDEDYIYAAPFSAASSVYRWKVGQAQSLPWKDILAETAAGWNAAYGINGIVLNSGALYACSSNLTGGDGNAVLRTLGPTTPDSMVTPPLMGWSSTSAGTGPLAKLKVSATAEFAASDTTLTMWAVSDGTLYFYMDVLALPSAAPTLITPVDGELIKMNPISGGVNNVTFTWNQIPYATSYDVFVCVDPACLEAIFMYNGALGTGVDASGLPVNTATVDGTTFMPGNTYYYHIRTGTAGPLTSPFSETRSFTIESAAAIAPTIGSPANGATIDTVNPAFSWGPVSGATMYEFQLAVSPSMTSPIHAEKLAETGIRPAVKLDTGMTYFWRVRVVEPQVGEWSTIANFTVAEPEAPAPPPVEIKEVPAPVINIPAAPPAQEIVLPEAPAPPAQIAPGYIWAIIIIGAVLVIAVIVLIVRTRRTV